MNLPDFFTLSGKLYPKKCTFFVSSNPILIIFLICLLRQFQQYKNSYVGPTKCHFLTPGSYFKFLRIEIVSNLDWTTFKIFYKICNFWGFEISKKGIWSSHCKYVLEFGIELPIFWNKIMLMAELDLTEIALQFFWNLYYVIGQRQRSKSLPSSFIYNIVQYPEYSKVLPQILIMEIKSKMF